MLTMQVKMEEEGWKRGMEEGWNNGLSGGDIAAVVLYFILVLGIGLYVSPIPFFLFFFWHFQIYLLRTGDWLWRVKLNLTFSHDHHRPQQYYHHNHDKAQLQSMMRPNRDTIEGYFLAGKHRFWLPVRIIIRMMDVDYTEDGDTDKMINTCQLRIHCLLYPGWGFTICK